MIFLVMLSGLAAALITLSGNNVQIAHNHRKSDMAYRAAESGLEIMRYWLSRFIMPKTTPAGEYLATIVASLQSDLTGAGVTQIVVQDDGSIPSDALRAPHLQLRDGDQRGTALPAESHPDRSNARLGG
jgi:type II secretory pathway pseudopilin PulG